MRRVNFDYGNTCPQIDRAICDARGEIRSFLEDVLREASPLLDEKTVIGLADDYTESLYKNLEDAFERVRSSNEMMRDAADDQIQDLKDQIESLESEIDRYQSQETV